MVKHGLCVCEGERERVLEPVAGERKNNQECSGREKEKKKTSFDRAGDDHETTAGNTVERVREKSDSCLTHVSWSPSRGEDCNCNINPPDASFAA